MMYASINAPQFRVIAKDIKEHWWSRKRRVYLVTLGYRDINSPVFIDVSEEAGINLDVFFEKARSYKSVEQTRFVNDPRYSWNHDVFFGDRADAEDFKEWLLSIELMDELIGEEDE